MAMREHYLIGKFAPRWKTPEDMWNDWLEYVKVCETNETWQTSFQQRSGKHVCEKVKSPICPTLKGFFVHCRVSPSVFAQKYKGMQDFAELCEFIEISVEEYKRRAFEQKTVPYQLSGLWMSRYDGYKIPAQKVDEGTKEPTVKVILERRNIKETVADQEGASD